jgi:hypothetical protein
VSCDEEIRPAAAVCPHCRNTLAPYQGLADQYAVLDGKISALLQEMEALRAAFGGTGAQATAATDNAARKATDIGTWPHMVDNLFLGIVTLLAAHWLASTLPVANRAVFRLVALCVALPFGYRFERNARIGTVGQAIAALGFGSFGTLAIGVLDMAVAGHLPESLTVRDIIESVVAVSISHFAGSALAHLRQQRADRAANLASASATPQSLKYLEPARIKSTAELVKTLYDAAAPLAAGCAALWAAFGHTLF